MAQMAQNTSLSLSARLALYLGPPATVLLISTASPKAGLLTTLAFIPAAGLYKAYSKSRAKNPDRHADLEPLIWTTLISATAGVGVASLVQVTTGYGLATALFGNGETRNFFVREMMRTSVDGLRAEDIARRAAIASSWKYVLFNAVTMLGAAGLTEETLKYLSVAYSRRRLRNADEKKRRKSRAPLDYALAFGLGIGLVETIGPIYSDCKNSASWAKLALDIFERVVLGSMAHLLGASISALRSIRKDREDKSTYPRRSWTDFFSIIGPSMLLHGVNNFGLISFSAYNGNIGWIHPTSLEQNAMMAGMYSVTMVLSEWLGRREWKKIEEADKKDK